jgi:hypothetical protein
VLVWELVRDDPVGSVMFALVILGVAVARITFRSRAPRAQEDLRP